MNIKILTQKDIVKSYEKGFKDGVKRCITDIMAIITITLQDKYGWKKEQLLQLENRVNTMFESVEEGRVTLQEIVEAKEQEIGMVSDNAVRKDNSN